MAGQVGMVAAGDLEKQINATPTESTAIHAVVGGGIAALGGGNALQGALGAGASEAASGAMGDYFANHGIDPNGAGGQALMNLGSTLIGRVVGGGAGAATALYGNQFNRQLHPTEQQLAQTLAAKSNGLYTTQQIEDAMRLSGYSLGEGSVMPGETAQEGTLVNVKDAGSIYDTHASWMPIQGAGGNQYLIQQYPSQVTPDLAAYIVANTGGANSPYAWAPEQQGMSQGAAQVQALSNWYTSNHVGTRALGALQMVGGGLEAAGGALTTTTCETGFGCFAAMYLMGAGADNYAAGSYMAGNGQSTAPFGQQGLQTLGLSPNAASLIYGATQLVPAGVEAYIANRAVNAEAAANAWARGTYTGESFSTFDGGIYRYTLPEYASGTWDIYPGNIAADHRYSPPGVGAVYAGTSADTAAAEVASYGALEGKTLVTKNIVMNNVLDLTDPAAQQALGVTPQQLVDSSHGGQAYEVTQRISAWARDQGYQGILAPSAQDSGGTNLISFKSLGDQHK